MSATSPTTPINPQTPGAYPNVLVFLTALCSPARASLMTGLYAHEHHMFNNSTPRYSYSQRPQDGDWPFLGSSHWHPSLALGPLVRSVAGGKAGTLDVAPERFPDAVAAQYATSFLRHRDPGRPFVLFCSFPGPHSPWLVPEAFGIRYTPDEVPIWPNRNDDCAGKPLNQRKLRRLEALLAEARRLGDGQVLMQSLAAEEGLPPDATGPLRLGSGT